jgi:hypothetical protein
LLEKIPCQKELVRERELEHFAKHVAGEIVVHDAAEMIPRDKPKAE